MSEIGSDDSGLGGLRTPAVVLNNLRELELAGVSTPVIWSIVGELTPNPVLRMPALKRLVLESMELDEEEQALLDLPLLAPQIQELVVRTCSLRDEADLYHCIRCLPYLEVVSRQLSSHTNNAHFAC